MLNTDSYHTPQMKVDKLEVCPTLQQMKTKAGAAFQTCGLPAFGSEDYQRTDLTHFFDTVKECQDSPYDDIIKSIDLPQGVYIGRLSRLEQLDQGLAKRFANLLEDPIEDAYALLNKLHAADTLCIFLPKKCVLETPIELTIEDDKEGRLFVRHIGIIADPFSEATIIINDASSDAKALHHVEIRAEDSSKIKVYDNLIATEKYERIATYQAELYDHSSVSLCQHAFSAKLCRNNFNVKLLKPDAEIVLRGLGMACKERMIDNYTRVEHKTTNCHTDELFKYIVDESGYGVFAGRILVEEGAQKTAAYQTNKNLLLSKNARMHAKPQLEIYADDVKCSHGMTTGQLDETAIFYMQQRGISYEEAKSMLTIAFAKEVLDFIDSEEIRDQLMNHLENEMK